MSGNYIHANSAFLTTARCNICGRLGSVPSFKTKLKKRDRIFKAPQLLHAIIPCLERPNLIAANFSLIKKKKKNHLRNFRKYLYSSFVYARLGFGLWSCCKARNWLVLECMHPIRVTVGEPRRGLLVTWEEEWNLGNGRTRRDWHGSNVTLLVPLPFSLRLVPFSIE